VKRWVIVRAVNHLDRKFPKQVINPQRPVRVVQMDKESGEGRVYWGEGAG
jgi:hypothetical protein